ncbi:hypothetical protein NVP1161O_111 [Vibrio phage 1.161.O._10N.261.48.C5]|nr:hypothetical protein NVP1161O_111 [Vibrio phage 1.161.O._10N.261.48.C5]
MFAQIVNHWYLYLIETKHTNKVNVMEFSKEALNVTQLLINSLQEGINLQTYYCFQPEEAKHVIRVLDLFCDTRLRYISVSFFNNPKMDQTIALKVYKKGLGYEKDLITFLDKEVHDFISNDVDIDRTPHNLRELFLDNFL